MATLECYICHQPVPRHRLSRHVASHLAGGMDFRPGPLPTPLNYDLPIYDDRHATPPSIQARAQVSPTENYPNVHTLVRPPTRGASDAIPQQPTAPNDFQIWLQNPTQNFPKYTTIDGRKAEPDLQEQDLVQAAKVLRDTTKQGVMKIIQNYDGFSCREHKEVCLDLVQKVPIFPGLVAYIYTHLVMCPRRSWISSDDWSGQILELERLVRRLEAYRDTECILLCGTIKEKLLGILRATKHESEEHKCNLALLDGTVVLNHDIHNLAALASLCTIGAQKKEILNQSGHEADKKKLAELFHNLLEANIELEEWYRRHFFNAFVLFTKESACCPGGMYLPDGIVGSLEQRSAGGFGDVYKGKVFSCLVAVKALKQRNMTPSEYNKSFCKEAVVWRYLRHPNCLPFYGIYQMSDRIALVSPWMDRGTLCTYLKDNPGANRTQLILDMVRGLNYLHSMQPHVAHRDIKPDNILVSRKGRACIADFGLASTFDVDTDFRTATSQIFMCGTYNYMAPEIIKAKDQKAKREVNKRACDIYALGCTIYMVYTGRHPFQGMNLIRLHSNVLSDQRPEFPEGKISVDMWDFVQNLWSPKPPERLTAQAALGWMELRASKENVALGLPPLEEEWEWKVPRDEKSLWLVSL